MTEQLKEIRRRFFEEHCSNELESDLRTVTTAPHDLFEWFKKDMLEPIEVQGEERSAEQILDECLPFGQLIRPAVITAMEEYKSQSQRHGVSEDEIDKEARDHFPDDTHLHEEMRKVWKQRFLNSYKSKPESKQ